MADEKTELVTPHKHWKELTDKDYLCAEMFETGVDKILTIKAVVEEVLENPMKKTVDTKPVIYFEETDLKLALNVANCDTITRLFKTGIVSEWVGKRIRDLDISRHSVIVLVKRGNFTIIPNGDTILREGDKIFMYSKLHLSYATDIEI